VNTYNTIQATWQPHKPHKTTQLIKKHMRKTTKAHVFIVIKKENWHYKSSSFRGEELYRGGKPPEDGCMKLKHVV
jgi:hypothetical protein